MFRSSTRLTAGPMDVGGAPSSELASLELRQLRRLEIASALEASTLLLLVCVAVPIKHLVGQPAMVRLMGPVHGLAFAFYVWTVVETLAGGGWSRRETSRLALAALVPFGGFANLGWLRRRAAALRRPGA
jgi:integral membrane protein